MVLEYNTETRVSCMYVTLLLSRKQNVALENTYLDELTFLFEPPCMA